MEKGSIAVIGNCYFDEIYSIDEFPEKDTKSIATSLKISLGGSATNTAAGLAALGVSTYLFTALGDDPDALRLFKKVRKKGILTQYITHLKGKSGRTIILLDKSKSSTKIGYQGVCSDLSESLMY
ncbi:MAG: carbohydrate kinase family protein, partial [Candidatus Kariarchaeaceae archaeon]